MMQKVLVIHGPNLNLLGEREPGVYGNTTFADLNRMILDRAEGLGLECEIFQSNHEGDLIDEIQSAAGQPRGCDHRQAARCTEYL